VKRVVRTKSRCERGETVSRAPRWTRIWMRLGIRMMIKRPSAMVQRLRHNNKHGDMVCPRCLVTWIPRKEGQSQLSTMSPCFILRVGQTGTGFTSRGIL
jgi:hypothetical protein